MSDERPEHTPVEQDDAPKTSSADEIEAAVLAQVGELGDGSPDDLVASGGRRAPRRSPLLSLVVTAFGLYLLVSMWGDFRYWWRPGEPMDLGHVGSLLEDGRMPDGLDDHYVVITGTPDVQHAARMVTKTRYVGYLRIVEAGGQLFAAIPRAKEEHSLTAFEGRYEGRMRRLTDTKVADWVGQFFTREQLAKVVDVDRDALVSAYESGRGGAMQLDTAKGPVVLGSEDRVRLVVEQPEASVQLGKTSFRRSSEAEDAVAALGYPYAKLDRERGQFHQFVVRIPADERDAAERKLNDGLDVPAGNADPKLGAVVLPRSSTYTVPAREVAIDGDTIAFPLGDNTTSPGFDARDGKLVERSPESALKVPLARVRAVRIEQPIVVSPDAYIVEVGSTPKDQRQTALLWAVVLGVVGLNLVSPVLWWRRRST